MPTLEELAAKGAAAASSPATQPAPGSLEALAARGRGSSVAPAPVAATPRANLPKLPYETKPGARPNPLRSASDMLEVPMDYLGAAMNTRSGKPEFDKLNSMLAKRDFSGAAQQYDPFDPEQIKRYADQNPDDPFMQLLAHNAVAAGLGTFVGESANPAQWATGKIAGPLLGLAGGRGAAFARAVRASSPEIDAAASAAERAAGRATDAVGKVTAPIGAAFNRATAPISTAWNRAGTAIDNAALGAVKAAARKVGYGLGSTVNRYVEAGLPQRGGREYVGAAFRGQAAGGNAAQTAERFVNDQMRGLTPAQKIEVQKLMDRDENGVPLRARAPRTQEEAAAAAPGAQTVIAPDGTVIHPPVTAETFNAPKIVPDPKKGPTLEQRAEALHRYRENTYALADALGIKDKSGVPVNRRFPMEQMNGRPVWKSDTEKPVATGNEAVVAPPSQPGGVATNPLSVRSVTDTRSRRPVLTPDGEHDLHPEYDPAHQLASKYGDIHRSIGNEMWRRSLEDVPSIDPVTGVQRTVSYPGVGDRPAVARMPMQYYLDGKDGQPRVLFGEGEEGANARARYGNRQAHAKTMEAFKKDPELRAFAAAHGIDPEMLGSRKLVKKGNLPTLSRIAELRRGLKGTTRLIDAIGNEKRRAVAGATGIARTVNRIATDLGGKADALQQNLDNLAATHAQASSDVDEYGTAAKSADKEIADRRAPSGAKAVYNLAKQMRDEAIGGEDAYDEQVKSLIGKVKPDWVVRGSRWVKAGEFADVPDKYLDLSNKPSRSPLLHGSMFQSGNADDVAQQFFGEHFGRQFNPQERPGDELREWMISHRSKPPITNYVNEAAERVAAAKKHSDAELADIYKYRDEMNALAKRAIAAKSGSRTVLRTLGPDARDIIASSKSAADQLAGGEGPRTGIGEQIVQGAAASFDGVRGKAIGMGLKATKRLADLTRELNENAQASIVKTEADKIYQKYFKDIHATVMADLEDAAHAPPGYKREAGLEGLASPSSKHMAIDEPFETFAAKSAVPIPKNAKNLWDAFRFANRLAKMSVVLLPEVHGINNEGLHYIYDGGTPEMMAQILTGKYMASAKSTDRWMRAWDALRNAKSPLLLQRATESGAVNVHGVPGFFGTNDGFNSTTHWWDRAAQISQKAGPLAKVVRPIAAAGVGAGRGYNAMQSWLFDNVEHGYAIDLFERKLAKGMSDTDAAISTRNTLGRNDNMTAAERSHLLNKIFYFYPWMKTAVAYWTRKGIIDPNTWDAPLRAIETNNEMQGYDDPSKPFTATLGKRADGKYRRITIPLPQRVTENIAELGRVPVDVVQSLRGKEPLSDALADLSAPYTYVQGHMNAPLELLGEAGQAAGAYLAAQKTGKPANLPPFNAFFMDPNAPVGDQNKDVAAAMASRFISPLSRVQGIQQDPAGGIGAYLTGAFDYGQAGPAQTAREHAVRSKINAQFSEAIKDAIASKNPEAIARIRALREAALNRYLSKPYSPNIPAASVAP